MLDVTTRAQAVLYDALNRKGIRDEDTAFRLRVTRDKDTGRKRFGLKVDRPHHGDQVVEHKGRKVLLVEEHMAARLDGLALKAIETPRGERLRFQRLSSRCGDPPEAR